MLKKRDVRCMNDALPRTILKWTEQGYRVNRITKDGNYCIVQLVDKDFDGGVK